MVNTILTDDEVIDAFCKQPHAGQFVAAFQQGARWAEAAVLAKLREQEPVANEDGWLPCPFCGSDDVSKSCGEKGDGSPWWYVECGNCAATGEPEEWNKRAAPQAPQAEQAAPVRDERAAREKAKAVWLAEPDDYEILEAYDRGWSDRAALASTERQPLTDEQIMDLMRERCIEMRWPSTPIDIARAIERAHGIGGKEQG